MLAELGSFLTELGTTVTERDLPADAPPPSWVAGVLAAVPRVAAWMSDRGVDEAVIEATLADVGRHLRLRRSHTGELAFDAPWWQFAVLSGSLYQLGRLQFDLRRSRPEESALPVDPGPWVLDVHIPEAGPLTPDAVLASFEAAKAFFARHFPAQPVTVAVCASWLLDPHLLTALHPESNIVRFQRLFTAFGEPRDDQLDAVYFTFGRRSLDDLDRLPRATSLQRAVLDRLTAGERWTVVHGYRTLAG